MRFILFIIPSRGTVCVENYWFCEVIIKVKGIMNHISVCNNIDSIEVLELFLDLPDNILL